MHLVKFMGLRVRPCLEDEFICMHPKKTIDELVWMRKLFLLLVVKLRAWLKVLNVVLCI